MIKIIFIFLLSVSVFSQTESTTTKDNLEAESPLITKSGIVGYKFYEGDFMSTRLSTTTNFHYGVLHTNVDNYKILEVPLIIKRQLNPDFQTLFGAKLNTTLNGGFTTLQLPEDAVPTLGMSFELGLQYDVNKNFMFEMRYS